MEEARLIERLRLIEALFAGAGTDGEKVAAGRAKERILERLEHWEQEVPPIEYRFSMVDMWSRKVFVTLLRRYGIRPYRYSGQRYTTVMARVSKRFVDDTLWPEFQEISKILRTYLSEVTDRVVSQVIHQDSSEAEVVEEPGQLPFNMAGNGPATTSAPANQSKPGQSFEKQGAASSSGGGVNQKRKKRKKPKKQKNRRHR